ncbi:MAG: serine/threonine-protein kinase [Planctomycetales bacterium]
MSDPQPLSNSSQSNESTFAPGQPTVLVGGGSPTELVGLLETYLADLEAGKTPHREAFLAAHPEWAGQLEQCLAGIEFMHRAAAAGSAGLPAQLGDFRIVREVGRGGMGVVYEAEQVSLKRRVALKVLRFGGVADSEAMQRFQREAETVAGLHHTNIVPIFAIGCEQDVRYYAMQFIEGHSLAQVAKSKVGPAFDPDANRDERTTKPLRQPGKADLSPFTAHVVANWGLQAAEALAHAHARGVVHRDVKPSNLILDPEGRIWLTDFGLAKRDDDVTLSVAGVLLGTPRYMSPEQAAGMQQPVDHRSDIYSLGATLYELVTSKPIFNAGTPHGVISQILSQEPQRPCLVAPRLPADLETIILKCLAKQPAQRYAAASDLAQDLEAFLDDRPISASRPTLVEQALRAVQKHRRTTRIAVISAGIALFTALVLFAAWRGYRESQNGQLTVSSDHTRYLAEIVDELDQPVVPPFPVPSPEPVTLPAGKYRLRVSTPGLLSDSWPVEIERRVNARHTVRLVPRWLWPPLETPANQMVIPMRFDQSDDIIVIDRGSPGGTQRPAALRRISGSTGERVWERDFVFDGRNVPAGVAPNRWAMLPAFDGDSGSYRGLLEPAVDLDGGGAGDLVVQSCQFPLVAAISAEAGTLLWTYQGRHPDDSTNPADPASPVWAYAGMSFVAGQSAVAAVNDDDVLDLIVCFVRLADYNRAADQQGWLAAISGKNGAQLWSRDLGRGRFAGTGQGQIVPPFLAACRPVLIHGAGGIEVAVLVEDRIVVTELKTGVDRAPSIQIAPTAGSTQAAAPRDESKRPVLGASETAATAITWLPPIAVDHDADGWTDLVLVANELVVASTAGTFERSRVQAIEFPGGKRAWERDVLRAERDSYGVFHNDHPSHLLSDFDGDRRPDLVVVEDALDERLWKRTTAVARIDVATGRERWRRALTRHSMNFPAPAVRFLSGVDLDGDRVDEVFVTAYEHESASSFALGRAQFVTALSGATGQALWRKTLDAKHHNTSDRNGPLAWWNPGPDGRPMLIVPARSGPGEQLITYFLAAADGRVLHILPEVSNPRTADFNGDGLLDLCYSVDPQGAPRLITISGGAPAAWQRLGNWRTIGDVDRDGIDDFVSRDGVAASGADERPLWRISGVPWSRSYGELSAPLPLPEGDLDGDGVPDLIGPATVEQSTGPNSTTFRRTISAVSGSDGHRLWVANELLIDGQISSSSGGSRFQYPSVQWADLDGDRRAEILVAVAGMIGGQANPALCVASGADGRSLWQAPIVNGTVGAVPDLYGPPRYDLNGDGVLDLVLWTPAVKPIPGLAWAELSALSGKDGVRLWSALGPEKDQETTLLWPVPAVDDLDGDGLPEVVVLRRLGYILERGHESELSVLDGRTGELHGQFTWVGDHEALPPLLVDFKGDGRRSICLGIAEEQNHVRKTSVVVLNAAAKEVRRESMALDSASSLGVFTSLWRKFDLDGDGLEELLYPHDGQLIAADGAGRVVWSWALLPEYPEIVTIVPGNRAGVPATVVVWAGRAVTGLSGSDGRPNWSSDVPIAPVQGSSSTPFVGLARGNSAAGLPVVVFNGENFLEHLHTTIGRQALPVDRRGQYTSVPVAPLTFQPIPELETPGIKLPWVVSESNLLVYLLVSVGVPSGALTVFSAIIPWWLALTAYRRRSCRLSIVLLTYVAIGVLEPVQRFLAGLLLAPFDAQDLAGKLVFHQGASAVSALLLPWLLVREAVRERRMWPAFVAALFVIGLTAPFIHLHVSTMHNVANSHPQRFYFWAGEIVAKRCLLALVCTPGAIFWWTLWRDVRENHLQRAFLRIVAATVAGVLAAAVFLAIDSQWLPEGLRYSSRGWWTAWFLGVYAVGAIVLLGWMVRRGRAWWMRRGAR